MHKIATYLKASNFKEGDKVKYTPHDKKFGIELSGILYSIDHGYRAHIVTDKDIKNTAIKKNDIVKVLLREGQLSHLK